MQSLSWSSEHLTDEELIQRLNSLPTVYFGHNLLETLPDLTRYRQLNKLKSLRVTGNHVREVCQRYIPKSVETLDLERNRICTLTDLCKLSNLKEVNLSSNKLRVLDINNLPPFLVKLDVSENEISTLKGPIQSSALKELYMKHNKLQDIDPSDIPLSVEVLDLAYNGITQVGDFSKHTHLKCLKLGGYSIDPHISSIHPLNTDFSRWQISHFTEEFFATEAGYKSLIAGGFRSYHLKVPPEETFQSGYQTIVAYFGNTQTTKLTNLVSEVAENVHQASGTPCCMEYSANQGDTQNKEPDLHSLTEILPPTTDSIDETELDLDRGDRVGNGTFGAVYRGYYLGTRVAVKEILIQSTEKQKLSEMITDETMPFHTVKHANIVQYIGHTFIKEHGDWYILLLLELINGNSLKHILGDVNLKLKFGMSQSKRGDILLNIAHALAYLHDPQRQIVHGDIKAGNIMISRAGEVKLCDIGLNKIKQASNVALKTMALQGTPAYMAPEQLLEKKEATTKKDVYAFGMTMFEVLYDEPAHKYDNIEKLLEEMKSEDIPTKLRNKRDDVYYNLILQCVQPEPSYRLEAAEIVIALNTVMEDVVDKLN